MTKLCNGQAMESIHARDAERATCMTFCRDTITRLADKHHLHRAQIETLLTDRVRDKIIHCCYLLATMIMPIYQPTSLSFIGFILLTRLTSMWIS